MILQASADESIPPIFQTLNSGISQVITVQSISPEKSKAVLSGWEKKDGDWQKISAIEAVLGRNGFALEGQKQEGDGKTPSGIFPLKRAFGYLKKVSTGLEYRQVTSQDFWIDDPAADQYNRWVTVVGTPQADSFERLKRDDDLYKYGIVIEYNTDPVIPGKGSAIFIHVWRGADGGPTAGCVGVSQENMVKLLSWLKRSQNPAIILGEKNQMNFLKNQ